MRVAAVAAVLIVLTLSLGTWLGSVVKAEVASVIDRRDH